MPYLVLDKVETSLFRPLENVTAKTGVWTDFFHHLWYRRTNSGRAFGMRWLAHKSVHKIGSKAMRFTSWMEMTSGDNRFIASLHPYWYEDEKSEYLDQQFVVAGALNRISEDVDMVTLRFNYRFRGWGGPPVAARY